MMRLRPPGYRLAGMTLTTIGELALLLGGLLAISLLALDVLVPWTDPSRRADALQARLEPREQIIGRIDRPGRTVHAGEAVKVAAYRRHQTVRRARIEQQPRIVRSIVF